MVWNTSFDRLHKSLNRDLLNRVANFLNQIPELDDVIFDTVEGKISNNRLGREEVQKYEKLLIKNRILPQDKIHYLHRITCYCYRIPKSPKKKHYGVYGVYVDNELVYIGMTMRDFKKRWKEHIDNIQNNSDELYFYKCVNKDTKLDFRVLVDAADEVIDKKSFNEDEIKSMEYALIKVLKPKYNLAGNKYKYHW